MYLTLTFALSGLGIAALFAAKRVELRYGRTFLLIRMISRGDERVREWGHGLTALYAREKERAVFLFQKQLPLKARSHWNKLSALARKLGEEYLERIRDAKMLHGKRSGMSEFLGKLNEVEKGNGKIDEPWEER